MMNIDRDLGSRPDSAGEDVDSAKTKLIKEKDKLFEEIRQHNRQWAEFFSEYERRLSSSYRHFSRNDKSNPPEILFMDFGITSEIMDSQEFQNFDTRLKSIWEELNKINKDYYSK